jgi:histone-lysine N-methyltransferase SETMAR
LHHDNAPAHTALPVRKFLASKQITVLEHPPYSPDLAPNDFFLLPKIKEILKGRHFDDIE